MGASLCHGKNPGLKSITDLKAHAQIFAEISTPDVGRIYGGPPGRGSEIIINNLYTALEIVDKILAWGEDNSASPEELALHFFKTA